MPSSALQVKPGITVTFISNPWKQDASPRLTSILATLEEIVGDRRRVDA
jgi:hypothetical protein